MALQKQRVSYFFFWECILCPLCQYSCPRRPSSTHYIQCHVKWCCDVNFSPSCYIVSLINIDNWPCLRINNFQQMNQTRSSAETSTLHDLRALQVIIDQSENPGQKSTSPTYVLDIVLFCAVIYAESLVQIGNIPRWFTGYVNWQTDTHTHRGGSQLLMWGEKKHWFINPEIH